MSTSLASVVLGAILVMMLPSDSGSMSRASQIAAARESRVQVGKTSLFVRDIGRGHPIIVLHGGPDFDHRYLLPDLDRLADTYRLIYYDQRGRGDSADGVQPEDVTMASEIDDLDKVRQHHQLESAAILGHSWGAVLALEYALRHPTRVSHLILMNPAPASTHDLAIFRKSYLQQLGAAMDRQQEIATGAAYKEGDPEVVAARYRIHFTHALARQQDYEKLMAAMKTAFVKQGKTGILKARAVEDRLMRETWEIAGYDLLPGLRNIRIPTLVIAADHDFIPVAISRNIAQAIPKAGMVTLKNCGHFAYLECGDDVRVALDGFLPRSPR